MKSFVESCIICQTEKSDHTLSKVQLKSPTLLASKWQGVSIGFVMVLSLSAIDSIMIFIDKDTRMTHSISCSKTVSVAQTANQSMQEMVKLHGILKHIETDEGKELEPKFWKEQQGLMETTLRYSSECHPQTQSIIERLNLVVN